MTDALSTQAQELEKLRMEYQIEKLRIEHSALPLGRVIRIMTYIAGAIALLVILCVVTISIIQVVQRRVGPDAFTMPDVLVNWGGIILGFYFGQYVSLMKDYMGSRSPVTGNPPQANT